MRTSRDALDRLLRAAARVSPPQVGPAPAGLVGRALAARREALAGSVDWLQALGWLRRGLALACALTALVVALNLSRVVAPPGEDLEGWDTLTELTWVP